MVPLDEDAFEVAGHQVGHPEVAVIICLAPARRRLPIDRERGGEEFQCADIRVSWMQRLPAWRRHFRAYLPLYPFAIEGMDLRGPALATSQASGPDGAFSLTLPPGKYFFVLRQRAEGRCGGHHLSEALARGRFGEDEL